MSTESDDVITEQIGFLEEQLGADDDPAHICTFQVQIWVLQTAQLDRIEELIDIKRKDLEASKNVFETERICAEIEALE